MISHDAKLPNSFQYGCIGGGILIQNGCHSAQYVHINFEKDKVACWCYRVIGFYLYILVGCKDLVLILTYLSPVNSLAYILHQLFMILIEIIIKTMFTWLLLLLIVANTKTTSQFLYTNLMCR